MNYNRNKLTSTMLRIDFQNPIDFTNENIAKKIADNFPNIEKSSIINKQITFTEAKIETQDVKIPVFNFYNINKANKMSLYNNCIVIDNKQYNNYIEFKKELLSLLHLLHIEGMMESQIIFRLGLRYINIFDDFDLNGRTTIRHYIEKKYINDIMANIKKNSHYSRCVNSLEYNSGDKKSRVQYGFFNPHYPSQCKNYSFVLDIDSYIDYAIKRFDTIEENINLLHDEANNIFEDFITDNTRDMLNNA